MCENVSTISCRACKIAPASPRTRAPRTEVNVRTGFLANECRTSFYGQSSRVLIVLSELGVAQNLADIAPVVGIPYFKHDFGYEYGVAYASNGRAARPADSVIIPVTHEFTNAAGKRTYEPKTTGEHFAATTGEPI